MKSKKMKSATIFAAIALCMLNASAYSEELSPEKINSNAVVDAYLLDAGYPQEYIDDLSDDIKNNLYDEKCTFQSVSTSYGIKTDKYNITYTKDEDDNILIDNENMNKLTQYMNDKNEIAKVLYFKDEAQKGISTAEYGTKLLIDRDTLNSNKSLESRIDSFYMENSEYINELSKEAPIDVLSTSTNFTANIFISHVSYDTNSKRLEKKITYHWDWNYDPIMKEEEKIAIAFSKNFEIIQSSAYASYYVDSKKHIQGAGSSALLWYPTNITETKKIFSLRGKDVYNEYSNNVGMGHTFKLNHHYSKEGDPSNVRYQSYAHRGYFWYNIEKYYDSTTNDSFTAKVEQYHKTVIFDSGSFTFSEDGPSITLSLEKHYDQIYIQATDPAKFLVGKS